jgi:hypothetical protein
LVTMIMKAAFEDLAHRGYRYSINLSGGDVTILGSLTMGWKSAGAMAPVAWEDRHAAVLRYVREAVGRLRFFWRYAGARALLAPCERHPFVHLDHSGGRGLGRAGRFVSLSRTPRCEAMAGLVERLPYDGRIRHARDTEFFAWRFRNPWDEYRFLYWEDRRLEGYLVLQRYEAEAHRNRRVNILDWEATTEQVRSDLLTAAVESGRFAELAIWTITLQEDAKRLLETMGFAPVDSSRTKRGFPAVLVRPVRDEDLSNNWMLAGRRLLGADDWDLRMLYRL